MIYHSPQQGQDAVMFPVSEVDVFAETEPGRFERIDGKKAIVNTDSRRVLSVVSNQYRILHNRKALEARAEVLHQGVSEHGTRTLGGVRGRSTADR